jgi:hypothetical protein
MTVDTMPTFFADSLAFMPLLAQTTTETGAISGGSPSPSTSWGIVLFLTILGLIVTLSPPRRTYEIKKPKDE